MTSTGVQVESSTPVEDTAVVKLVRARTGDPAAFDAAQRRWGRIAGEPGFRGQFGGWSVHDPARAVVVAFWSGRAAHDAFLAGPHDLVAAAGCGTRTSLVVDVLDAAVRTGRPVPGGVLRTAFCRVRPGRSGHVLDVQRDVWFPAMADAGMRWGVLATGGDTVLVASTWPSELVHDDYRRERVPGLRDRAGAGDDFTAVDGDLVRLEPAWTVAPATPRGDGAPADP